MKVILSIGFNDKDSKKQEVTTTYAMRITAMLYGRTAQG
jgi:hypothetical protein